MTKHQLHVGENFWLPADTVTSTGIVYGGKGMGKTNLLSVIMEECARVGIHFSALDAMGVLHGLRYDASGKGPGVEVLILGGIHGDIPIEPTGGAVVADLVVDEDVSVIIDISRRPDGTMWSIAERVRFVTDYFKRLYQRQGEKRRPLLQLVDEAARFAPQVVRKGEEQVAACMGAIAVVVEEGRNVGIGCWLFTQRSARLNKDVAELADSMVAFRTTGPNSRRAVLDWMGEYVEKEHLKVFDEKLRSLARGTALVVSPGWLEFENFVEFKARRTFDSSATPKPGETAKKVSGGVKPDLSKYAARMQETIERAKANDPRELQRQVKELQGQLQKAAKVPPAAPAPVAAATKPDPRLGAQLKQLRKAVEEAMKFIVTINAEGFFKAGGEAVNKVQIQKAIDAAVENVTKMLEAKVEARNREIEKLRSDAGKVLARLKALASEDVGVEVAVKHNEPFTLTSPPPRKPPQPRAAAPIGDLTKGEHVVLIAIAQHPDGVTKEQLSVLTRYKRSSRDTYLQKLGARGFILAGERITATEDGRKALGDGFEPLPTGAALLDHWRAALPAGERKVLDVVVEAYPEAVDKDVISEKTEYQRSSRDTYLQKLKARHLVVESGRGMVCASQALFG